MSNPSMTQLGYERGQSLFVCGDCPRQEVGDGYLPL